MAEILGLDGLGKVGEVDVNSIVTDELLNTLKRLPEGNTVALIKQLPQSVLSQICTQGVNEKITAYLPTAIVGIGGGIVVGMITGSFTYGFLATAALGALVYFITQPSTAPAQT